MNRIKIWIIKISLLSLMCSSSIALAESIYLTCRISGQSLGQPLSEQISITIDGATLSIEHSYDFTLVARATVTDTAVYATQYAKGQFSNGQKWNSKTDVELNRLTGMISIRGNVITSGQFLDQYASGTCTKVMGKAF